MSSSTGCRRSSFVTAPFWRSSAQEHSPPTIVGDSASYPTRRSRVESQVVSGALIRTPDSAIPDHSPDRSSICRWNRAIACASDGRVFAGLIGPFLLLDREPRVLVFQDDPIAHLAQVIDLLVQLTHHLRASSAFELRPRCLARGSRSRSASIWARAASSLSAATAFNRCSSARVGFDRSAAMARDRCSSAAVKLQVPDRRHQQAETHTAMMGTNTRLETRNFRVPPTSMRMSPGNRRFELMQCGTYSAVGKLATADGLDYISLPERGEQPNT